MTTDQPDPDELHSLFTLTLIKSETIPPSPNKTSQSGSLILDWLPDFLGHSWLAYGASSLLVISHFPSPLSPNKVGPIFRQVLELSVSSSSVNSVSAVSWSSQSPSADLAAAADNVINIFQYDSSLGSFCWSQTTILVQSSKVEAIAWTGSGDGIVAGGIEVILWKRNVKSWEIAWKFKMKVSQALVSATWSVDGPSAAGRYSPGALVDGSSSSGGECVSVFLRDGKSGYVASELRHPEPVCGIQWRPSGGSLVNRGSLCAHKHVLLTSCLDGTVRLWSEIDGNRNRRGNKDSHDPLTSRPSFCVVAVVEINQLLHGTLGTDVFVHWALDVKGLVCVGDEDNQLISGGGYHPDEVGSCEWLIGVGPENMLTFWAVHCLDDVVTTRSPRVTLWKRQEIEGPALEGFSGIVNKQCIGRFDFTKVAIWRNCSYGPPSICSLVQPLPSNALAWLVLCSQSSSSSSIDTVDESSDRCETNNNLYCQSRGILETVGHSGKIVQVSLRPRSSEVELAVSLDSNGLLMFWSISTGSSGVSSLVTFNPSWQLIGETAVHGTISPRMSLHWAPLSLDVVQVLLIGHSKGVDCFFVKTCETKEEEMSYHKLCTIPFARHDHQDAPDELVSVPVHSTREESLKFTHFLVSCVWMKNCVVESLEWTFHCNESSENSRPSNFDRNEESRSLKYEADFAGKKYCVAVKPASSYFPDVRDDVSSLATVSRSSQDSNLQQKLDMEDTSFVKDLPYHLATGHSDGNLRLWRINISELSVARAPFELVGMFSSFHGPITNISVAGWGQKIAIISPTGHTDSPYVLYILEPLRLAAAGTIELEDKIVLNESVVALRFLLMENILYLGVCFQNELRIYFRRVHGGQTPLWVSIAVARTSPAICNFYLGPKTTLVIIHENYFSVFSQWSLMTGNNHHGHLSSSISFSNEKDIVDRDSPECLVPKINIFGELSSESISRNTQLFNGAQPTHIWQNKNLLVKMTEATEQRCGPLDFHHPDALLMNIYSGHWKRAYVALCNLVDSLASNSKVEQGLNTAKSGVNIQQIKLSNYFEGQLTEVGACNGFQWNKDLSATTQYSDPERGFLQFGGYSEYDSINNVFNASATSSESWRFNEILDKLHALETGAGSRKMKMFAIVDLLREISNSQSASVYESLDEAGRRFWCAIRLQQLDFFRRNSKMPLAEELAVDSRLIGWAVHSDCQADLFSAMLPTEPTWEDMRKFGVGYWYTNLTDLRTKMEKLARCRYLKSKDPKACALLYMALNRLQVLTGLFKISKDEKDKPLVAFLSRNFQEEKHRAAALKNAYVLMGRHQFELAIAFFLLGGDIISAITVCSKSLGDEQLALVICRLVEGQGGPTEHHLISRILLPSAVEKGDHWLASTLEWIMGNYVQSYLTLLGLREDSLDNKLEKSLDHALRDPSIGQYCQMLATKNSLKNAAGDQTAAILCRWGTAMTASALNKCGLPLEALECLSSTTTTLGATDIGLDGKSLESLPATLRPFLGDGSRWLSHEVACQLEHHVKLDLALQYLSKLIKEHPCSINKPINFAGVNACSKDEMSEFGACLENFELKLDSALSYIEQKFSLIGDLLLHRFFVSLEDDRLLPVRCHLLRGFVSQVRLPALRHMGSSLRLQKQLKIAIEHLSCSFSRFVSASCIASSQALPMKSNDLFRYSQSYLRVFIPLTYSIRSALMVVCNDAPQGLLARLMIALQLYDYCLYFASAMLQCNTQALTIMMRPIAALYSHENSGEIDILSLNVVLSQVKDALAPKSSCVKTFENTEVSHLENGQGNLCMRPEDEKWRIIAAFLWQYLSKFIKYQLKRLFDGSSSISVSDISQSSCVSSEVDDNGSLKHVEEVSTVLIEAVRVTGSHLSCHSYRHLAFFFWCNVEDGTSTQTWLQGLSQCMGSNLNEHLRRIFGVSVINHDESSSSCSELLDLMFRDPKIISDLLTQLETKLPQLSHCKHFRQWSHLSLGVLGEDRNLESYKQDGIFDSSPRSSETGRASAGSEQGLNLLDSAKKGSHAMGMTAPFHNPREIHRQSGELLEALCINGIEKQQAAIASNKKGISFFTWDEGLVSRYPSEYIWSDAEWPRNGWTGTESTPLSTCVTAGVGIKSDKESHLGLGGATVGIDSQAGIERELTGGGGFGIPGYAGIGAMGWGIQEDYDHSVDPLVTLSNVHATTLASHPSRPILLVGSSNTRTYLWEFGEEKASATYGVLPAANAPPPYALASITGLQFDYCGHRFANSASDGTVCTWQLEAGGRSHVTPTESALCFSGHASDICYVSTSGSIIAAAGYSSNGVNVVVWDTLAPQTSSRASVMCHEGGASSIAVFDKDSGTGSVSPLIVTGGKGGDVGLHDFRYIATGKIKRHRHSDASERISDITALERPDHSSYTGDQNRHGMLWYIPKAHAGSITKIATIPNTSFFLTGSKDGDVKLWDARKASLVFHWPKIHERHTFLQRTSQGFGGVTRVGVTDIQVISDGFLTCGGDGLVKLVQLKIFPS